jgi:superfamily II DNA helicase RecQ
MLVYLRQLFGSKAGWKNSLQYESLQQVLALERDVLVGMPTGGGKSLLAILPTLAENGYTVVAVPLISLAEDWERRLTALKVPYERYHGVTGPPLHGRHNLILTTADMIRTTGWDRAIGILRMSKPLLRYMFDEIHFYAMDLSFRTPVFANPFELRRSFPCQVIGLSATITPAAQAFLTSQFNMTRPLRVSSTSHRPELQIRVLNSADGYDAQIQQAKHLIHRLLTDPHWTAEDKFLVFVTSVAEGERAAKDLDLELYHANSTEHPISEEERQGRFDRWISGKAKGLVGTTAINGGIDQKHVRMTMHFGVPYDLVTFEQQRGRAGRDGHVAWNYIVARARPRPLKPIDLQYGDMSGVQAMHDFVYEQDGRVLPDVCHSFQITSVIDGHGQTCTMLQSRRLCKPCAERE